MNNREKILARLRSMLKEKRYEHSLCVERRAAELAERYGEDAGRAALAGLLHDICHDLPKNEQLKYLKAHGILLDNVFLEHAPVWHQICGALYVQEHLHITDAAVLSAIRCHTTGKAGMTVLDRIVYLADATSQDRTYPGADSLRETVDGSLEEGMLLSLSRTIGMLLEEKRSILRDTWEAYNETVLYGGIRNT